MSADNYLYVRKICDGAWAVTEESASADKPGPVRGTVYDTWKEAYMAAQDILGEFYVEYGIHSDPAE